MNRKKETGHPLRTGRYGKVAVAACLPLLIPLVAMQVTEEVRWGLFDFVVMWALLFGAGSLFVFLTRRFPNRSRLLIGIGILLVFLYLWAELAVGIFTDLGS